MREGRVTRVMLTRWMGQKAEFGLGPYYRLCVGSYDRDGSRAEAGAFLRDRLVGREQS